MSAYRNGFTVCISSVVNRENSFLDYRYTAKNVIEKLGMEAVRNPEDVGNQYNFDRELRENCDFFIVLLGKVPSEAVESELRIALSRGVPILVFVRATYDKDGHTHMPKRIKESILKISPELYNMHITLFSNCEDLSRSLEDELQSTLFRKMKLSPLIGLDPPVAYTEGVKLIREAKNRIVLCQKTSIMLLGPRKNNVEEIFYEELLAWLEKQRNQSAHFIHYFSKEDTFKAMASDEYDLVKARDNLLQILEKANNNISIRVTDNLDVVPHLIGDTGIGLNFWIGNNRYYLFLPCFLTKDSELQSIIANVQRLGRPMNINEILQWYSRNLGGG